MHNLNLDLAVAERGSRKRSRNQHPDNVKKNKMWSTPSFLWNHFSSNNAAKFKLVTTILIYSRCVISGTNYF